MSTEIRFFVDKLTSQKIDELQESLGFATRGKLFEFLLNEKYFSEKEAKK